MNLIFKVFLVAIKCRGRLIHDSSRVKARQLRRRWHSVHHFWRRM